MLIYRYSIIILFIIINVFIKCLANDWARHLVRPPQPYWKPNKHMLQLRNTLGFDYWSEDNDDNLWEHSGMFEGDIMLHREYLRNGLLSEKTSWTDAVVPFYIDSNDFNNSQIMIILKVFKTYHDKTCIRFRPYEKGDVSWIVFKGNYSGCWSSVGRRRGGQIINLNTPKCVKHGIIIHELLHALGFYHQQSSTERDDYIKINWENISPQHKHNFNKYSRTYISNYGVEYDYHSIMHYSSKAFTKNGNYTIEALDPYETLGQRGGFSEKDIQKLNEMYDNECSNYNLFNWQKFGTYLDNLFDYFKDTLDIFIP